MRVRGTRVQFPAEATKLNWFQLQFCNANGPVTMEITTRRNKNIYRKNKNDRLALWVLKGTLASHQVAFG